MKVTKGCRVSVSLIDSEEGFGYLQKGTVVCDWEKINYDKKVDVEFDNGGMVIMYPKWLCEIISKPKDNG